MIPDRRLLPDPAPFLESVFAALRNDGVDVADFDLDHICYRVASQERYLELREQLAQRDRLLVESVVGGRPIATFYLNAPYHFQGRCIEVLELPSPKLAPQGSKGGYPEGFEHVEFVTTEELLALTQRYPQLHWDMSGSFKATNADVRLHYAGFSVKFHRRSLAEVIAEEQRDQGSAKRS